MAAYRNIFSWFANRLYVLCVIDSTKGELLVGITALLWGLWLLIPHFNAFDQPDYQLLGAVATKELVRLVFGFTTFACGVWSVAALLFDSRRHRRLSSIVTGLYYVFVTVALYRAAPASSVWLFLGVQSCSCFWTVFQISWDERIRSGNGR